MRGSGGYGARKYKLLVARADPAFHALVKKAASPQLKVFTGIDSMVRTALLLLMEDLENDPQFMETYAKVHNERFKTPGDQEEKTK